MSLNRALKTICSKQYFYILEVNCMIKNVSKHIVYTYDLTTMSEYEEEKVCNSNCWLCGQVSLGKCNELLAADYNAATLPKGCHSVMGKGKIAPNPKHNFTMWVHTSHHKSQKFYKERFSAPFLTRSVQVLNWFGIIEKKLFCSILKLFIISTPWMKL